MNNERRKKIVGIIDRLNKVKEEINDLRCEVSSLQDEEQEAYDNLPESMQDGERGTAIQDKIDELESAYGAIMDDSMIDLDEAISQLESAKE